MRCTRWAWLLALGTGLVGQTLRAQAPAEGPVEVILQAQATPPPAAAPRPSTQAPAGQAPATPPRTGTPAQTAPAQVTPTVPFRADQSTAAANPPPTPRSSGLERTTVFRVLGDPPPLPLPGISFGPPGSPGFPPVPGSVPGAAVVVPSLRGIKIAENESPEPQDRVYVIFNYFDRLNEAANARLGSDLHTLRAYHETFGLEKTFLDRDLSLGLRLPLNTLTAESPVPGLGGESTDVGDLTVILKYAFLRDPETGDLLSGGLMVTAPTGPASFAGFDRVRGIHSTVLEPFVGFRKAWGDLFVYGFTSLDVPTESGDVMLWFNDVALGYRIAREDGDACHERFLRAIAPIFEVHVNTPLNHRGFSATDPAATPDVVDLTFGTIFELGQRSSLNAGVVVPVTGPRPFDWEALVQFNYRFGSGGSAPR